jgi:Clp amino terminal domain, pathogenicity island component
MYSRFDPEARIAVMQATEEARELGHSEVGPDHVLLGLLSNMRGSTFALLTEHGLRLDSAREVVVAQRAALAASQPSPTRNSDTSDQDSADPDRGLDPGLEEDREALRAIGIDLDKVREAVRSTFGDDITEEWGERHGRSGRRGQRGRRHHGGGGRGRRGPRSRQFADRGEFSDSLIGILRDLRHTTMRDASRERRERRGERGERGDRRQRGPALTADRLLLAIARSNDPVAQAVLGWANDVSALRTAIEARATQPVR